jgi:hypothetical protein
MFKALYMEKNEMVGVCSTYWRNRSLKRDGQRNLVEISAIRSTDLESGGISSVCPDDAIVVDSSSNVMAHGDAREGK